MSSAEPRRRARWLAGGLALLASAAAAHQRVTTQVTYDREVIRIVRRRCLPCHADGGGAIRLTGFDDARPWAKAIRDEVLAHRMPPWPPQPGVGEFANDASLSAYEEALLVAWAEGGAPEGEARDLPTGPPPPPPPLGPVSDAPIVEVDHPRALPVGGTLIALCVQGRRGEPIEVDLVTARGVRRPLLWVPRFDPAYAYTYRLRTPLVAMPGDRIEVRARRGRAALTLAPPAATPP